MSVRPRIASFRRDAGLTLLEVVVSVAMLSLLASVVMGAISFMETSVARERHRLQAMEVAHRVVAQYLDNPDLMPDPKLPIQQGVSYYRFTLREEVMMEDGDKSDLRRRRGRLKSELTVEEQLPQLINRLTVQVFLDDPATSTIDSNRPLIELVRIYDTINGRDESVVLKNLHKLIEQAQREQAERARREAQNAQRQRGGEQR